MISKKQLEIFRSYPVIASVRSAEDCERALDSKVKVLFMVGGDYFKQATYIKPLHEKGGLMLIYLDLIGGIGKNADGIDYAIHHDHIDGILSAKGHIVKMAENANLIAVSRIFMTDKLALLNGLKLADDLSPDFIELTPGLMPRLVKSVHNQTGIPIITSGFISKPSDVKTMLAAGAVNIASSTSELWGKLTVNN
ncbi:MAG: glycerol-3-phosphate responsive antiterminator [Eubacterium sp.]